MLIQLEVRMKQRLERCYNDVGGWRVSKCDGVKLPTDNYKFVKNELIKIPVYESND